MSDRAGGAGSRAWIVRLLAIGLLAPAVAAPSFFHDRSQERAGRVDGEFGLWARFDGDSLRVSWLTRESVAGFLEVSEAARGPSGPESAESSPSDGDESAGAVATESRRFETSPGRAHTAAFPAPERGELLLEYGALDDPEDRHRTRLYLDDGDGEEPARGGEAAPTVVTGVDSLYVIGDIHGEYDNLLTLLRTAGVIDPDLRWSAGRSHLAVVGDMMSRGRDVTAVLWFLYRLEREAEAAGGRIHILLGNHEIMVWLDDLRYVRPKERRIADAHGVAYHRMFDPRQSVLGRWLASKPAVMRIDDVLLAHGGVSTDYLDYTAQSHRDSLAAFMDEDLFYYWADTTVAIVMDSLAFERRAGFFWDDRSVFWYRDYAVADTLPPEPRSELAAELASVLREFDAELHVVGHTPVPTITEAFGGSLVLVNTVDFATELLLLVREGDGYGRYRIRIGAGEPEPL